MTRKPPAPLPTPGVFARRMRAHLRDPEVVAIVGRLRALVHRTLPDAEEREIPGWGIVAYAYDRLFCYVAPQHGGANLGFHQGGLLTDPDRLLVGTGKTLRHVRIRSRADLARPGIPRLLRQAALLERSGGVPPAKPPGKAERPQTRSPRRRRRA